ncbi:hypothetical protein [Rhodoblastus sp.]|uniref:hypothetical protein n=1 Tax=Rhodoblastus sp. TaxID=1962975 RepID=UPI003F9DAA8C
METLESLPRDQLKNDYPRQVYPDPPYQPPEYLAYLEQATNALKSVRIVVYAGMTAFVLLAAYGFFLIYLLTSDARVMAQQTLRMADQMELISRNMAAMNVTINDMRSNVSDMRASLAQMDRHMESMDASTMHMAATVALIQHSARNLDSSFGPAMGVMNNFMPFGAGGNSYPGAPPFAPLPAR